LQAMIKRRAINLTSPNRHFATLMHPRYNHDFGDIDWSGALIERPELPEQEQQEEEDRQPAVALGTAGGLEVEAVAQLDPTVAFGAVGGLVNQDEQKSEIPDFPLETLEFVPDASSSEDEDEEEIPVISRGPVIQPKKQLVAENRDSGTEPAGSLRAESTEESLLNELGIVPTIQLDFVPEDASEQEKQEEPVLWVYEEDVHEDF
ncbi:MAG: hypothetical protein GY698_18715, partial [Actinomycetia bacterium]|nr:hypothetical protein [Actinomycetes bacterium]